MNELDFKQIIEDLIWGRTKNKCFTTVPIGVFSVRVLAGYDVGDTDMDMEEYSTPILEQVKSIHDLRDFTVQVMAGRESRELFKYGTVPIEDVCKTLTFADKFDHCKARLNLEELISLCLVLNKKSNAIRLML